MEGFFVGLGAFITLAAGAVALMFIINTMVEVHEIKTHLIKDPNETD